MNTFSLSAVLPALEPSETILTDQWVYTGVLALLAVLILFMVLATVWIIIALKRSITNHGDPISGQSNAVNAHLSAVPSQNGATDDGALLAAITAAIAVVWESEHPGTSFRVVSYRHVGKRSPWNRK